MPDDARYMGLALAQCQVALDAQEVPVGAIVVKDGKVIAVGQNATIAQHDPTAHAEIVALRAAAAALGNYRLDGCELFVTLEPCAMCAGAILHARLKRVVFGAFDPKAGAAGSVLNLFDQKQLNHHTEIQGGVLEARCAQPLQAFFQRKRKDRRSKQIPLREDAVRTADTRFRDLPDYPWAAHYVQELPVLDGLRMHYLDEGPVDAAIVFLCLHGGTGWSYAFRKMMPIWCGAGHRVLAPDLIGFGKSDKPKRTQTHTFEFHRQCLLQLIEHLGLHDIVLVGQGWGAVLGLTLPMVDPLRYKGLLLMNALRAIGDDVLQPARLLLKDLHPEKASLDVGALMARDNPEFSARECNAYNAPFPDAGHRAALRAHPALVADAAVLTLARHFLQQRWTGRGMLMLNAQDQLTGVAAMDALRKQIAEFSEPWVDAQECHFLPEYGESAARAALGHFAAG